jgi:hypothetical protein
MAQEMLATKHMGRKRKNTGALVVQDNAVDSVKVNVLH